MDPETRRWAPIKIDIEAPGEAARNVADAFEQLSKDFVAYFNGTPKKKKDPRRKLRATKTSLLHAQGDSKIIKSFVKDGFRHELHATKGWRKYRI